MKPSTNSFLSQPEYPDLERQVIYGITEEKTVKSPLRHSEKKEAEDRKPKSSAFEEEFQDSFY